MYIKTLELSNYRNYNNLHIEFEEGTTILYGNNAQGKTNILEALYLSATTKSHRGSKDKEIIKFDEDEAHIKVIVHKHEIEHKIDMHLKKDKSKGVAIDGLRIKKSGELFGILNIVFFSPEDLNIIKNSPNVRRKFMDLELCQIDKIYYHDYLNYNKVLQQRNNLLKRIYYKPDMLDTLDIWNDKIVEYGSHIIKRRQNFIDMINDIIVDIHSKLTGGLENIKVVYNYNVSVDDYMDSLKDKQNTDLKYKTTQVGPHRDDITFYINDIDVKKYGSQGQQRTAALSLKLAEIELVKMVIKENPVLLLDDVMSELDSNRKMYLLDSIKDIQTIITCTGYDDFIQSRLLINKIYRVIDGSVSDQQNKEEI